MSFISFEQFGSAAERELLETVAKRDREIETMKLEHTRQLNQFLGELLCLIDDFECALSSVSEKSALPSFTEGITRILHEHLELLQRHGVTPMKAKGKLFDPTLHEALERVETRDVPELTVIREVKRGYFRGKSVLRPAKVVVAIAPNDEIVEF